MIRRSAVQHGLLSNIFGSKQAPPATPTPSSSPATASSPPDRSRAPLPDRQPRTRVQTQYAEPDAEHHHHHHDTSPTTSAAPVSPPSSAAAAGAASAAPAAASSGRHSRTRMFAPQPERRRDVPLAPEEVAAPRPVMVQATLNDDPVLDFLRQGKELLRDMHDGGDCRIVSETGVAGVWCLQLENLGEGNAVTGEMMLKLEEALRMVNRSIKTHSELIALVIRGSGLNFSYGTSKSVHQEMFEHDEGLIISRYMSSILLELQSLPIVTIAAIEGVAAGSAAEIALSCDFRIAAEDSILQFADTQNGITPGWGGTQRLAGITSPRTALLLTASGKPVTADEGLGLGVVDCVAQPGDTYNEAINFVETNLHDHTGLGGTHGEPTWRRHSIRRMKENVVATELFPTPEQHNDIEARNFQKTWFNDGKTMVERRQQASGLRRASINTALEDWATLADPHAMSLPLDEDVGLGLLPASQGSNTGWGRIGHDVDRAFTALFERKANQPVLGSPASESWVKHKYVEEEQRHERVALADAAAAGGGLLPDGTVVEPLVREEAAAGASDAAGAGGVAAESSALPEQSSANRA